MRTLTGIMLTDGKSTPEVIVDLDEIMYITEFKTAEGVRFTELGFKRLQQSIKFVKPHFSVIRTQFKEFKNQ